MIKIELTTNLFASIFIFVFMLINLVFIWINLCSTNKKGNSDNELDSAKDYDSKITVVESVEISSRIEQFFENENYYLNYDFSLTKLSEYIGLPKQAPVVSNVINNYLNTTFYELLAYHRIQYAQKMIKGNLNMTLDSICEYCGFRSQSTFNKYFKMHVGCSPSQYRRYEIEEAV